MNSKPQNKPAAGRSRQEPKVPKKITATYLHNSGLYYLQRFAASSGQFRAVMLRKVKKSCHHHKEQNYEDCQKLVDELVTKFERAGLINDESYTRGMISSLRRQGKSRRSIIAKLNAKGIASSLAEEKLEEYAQDSERGGADSETKAAIIFARRKKLGPFRTGGDETENEKALGVMARAGFSYDTSRRVLEMKCEEAETLIRL